MDAITAANKINEILKETIPTDTVQKKRLQELHKKTRRLGGFHSALVFGVGQKPTQINHLIISKRMERKVVAQVKKEVKAAENWGEELGGLSWEQVKAWAKTKKGGMKKTLTKVALDLRIELTETDSITSISQKIAQYYGES